MQDETKTPVTARPARSKRVRRWPLVLLIAAVVIVAGGAVAWYQLGGKLRWTESYRAALALVQKDPQVIAQLGEPIGEVWLPPSGSVYGENAHLIFKVEGPKGRAVVQADARSIAGHWALRSLNVTLADQKRISINTLTGEGGEGDAPVFRPQSVVAPKPVEAVKVPPPTSPGPDIQFDMPDLNAPQKAPAK